MQDRLLPMRAASLLLDYPSVWPLVLLPLSLGLIVACARWRIRLVGISALRADTAAVAGIVSVGLFVFTAWTYLRCAAFWDTFESREASVAALWLQGGEVYPDLASTERYCAPYGPALFLTLGSSQWLLGPSVFSTKLPGILASLTALALFWAMTRRQYASARAAWAMTGLLSALLLAFRQLPFWSKPDPLVLLTVTLGLFAALRRGGGLWPVVLGCCLGWAVDLKPHAAAYFLPVFVLAFQHGWRTRAFAVGGAVAAAVAAAPFVLDARQFSLSGYLAFLGVTWREGGHLREVLGFCRWMALLLILVGVAAQLTRHTRELTSGEHRARRFYYGALLLAAALVALPASSIGAGQPHLIPLLPSVLLALGDGLISGVPVEWRRPAPRLLWRAVAYSGVAACGLVAVQTVLRMAEFHGTRDAVARACRTDLHRVLARHGGATILTGAGGDLEADTNGCRQEAVFHGHPIGADVAAVMDYQRGGAPELNLARLTEEMQARRRRPVLWLLPRGSRPFSQSNLYDPSTPVYSEAFRQEFLARFELREHSDFYDVYFPRPCAFPGTD